MSWNEIDFQFNNWVDILDKFDLRSFKSLNIGYSKVHEQVSVLHMIYQNKNVITSSCLTKYYKKFGIIFINIDGGIEGAITKNIINDLIIFFKKKFKFFILKIDHQVMQHSNFFEDNGFFEFSSKPRYEQIKDFQFLKNEKDLQNSFSQYWRRNYKRSHRNKIYFKNDKIFYEKDFLRLFEETSKIKNFKNYYNAYVLKSIFKNFSNNLFVSKAFSGDKLTSVRAILYFKDRCWDLLSATSTEGRKNYSSYAVTYEVLKFCLNNNIQKYFLSGVDPKKNKSVYNFKKGVGSYTINIPSEKIFISNKSLIFIFKFLSKVINN